MNYNILFDNFVKEIELWAKDGTIPSSVTYDLQTFFKLRKKRLDKFGLKLELKFTPDFFEKNLKKSKYTLVSNEIYKSKEMIYRDYIKSERYLINNKVIYNKKKDIFLYCGILDVEYCKKDKDYIYKCPNCGASSSIEKLQTIGCSYCRTKFIVYDLLPKIVNYSFENDYTFKKIKLHKGIYIFISILLFEIISIYLMGINSFSIIIGIVIGLMFCFYMIMFKIIFKILKLTFKSLFHFSKDIYFNFKDVEQLKRIYSSLLKYDRKFNYSYFEGKAASLFRIIAFSDDLNCVPQYKCEEKVNMFSNLIDSTYQMLTLDSVKEYNDNLFVLISLYMNNTYIYGNKIKHKKERIALLISHDMKFKTKINFSIKEVNCKKCGSSFDALKNISCPHCHNEYHLEEDDWIVNRINKYKW